MLDRLTAQVGNKEEATRLLVARGHLKEDGKTWTESGAKRNAMTAAERAIDRAATTANKRHDQYKYDPKTNRATLKRKF